MKWSYKKIGIEEKFVLFKYKILLFLWFLLICIDITNIQTKQIFYIYVYIYIEYNNI